MAKESLFFSLSLSSPSLIMVLKIKRQWWIRFVQTKASNAWGLPTLKIKIISFTFSETLKFLLKHLPSKQEKADSAMKGEMIMPSGKWNPAHKNKALKQTGRVCWWHFKYSIPLHLEEPAVGSPSRQRQVAVLNKLKKNLHHITGTILPLWKQEKVTEKSKHNKRKYHHNLARLNW